VTPKNELDNSYIALANPENELGKAKPALVDSEKELEVPTYCIGQPEK
jgi:hypothetical protein